MVTEALVHLSAGEWLLTAAAKSEVTVNPNPDALPGMSEATKLIDGLAAAVLLACVAGFLLGVGQWVLGSKTSNFSQADSGRSKVLVSVLGAFGVGAVAAIINFFLSAGGAVK